MAHKPAEQQTPRMVKRAETVREITQKEAPQKTGVVRLSFRYIGIPFRTLGRGLAWVGHVPPLRFLGRILVPRYFRNSWKELRQVAWPSRRESFQLTGAVIIFALFFGLAIALVDFGLDKLFKQVLLK